MEQIQVIKSSGEKEQFSEQKVLNSIRRIGLPENLHQEVLQHIKDRLHQNISSFEIFSHISEFLDQKDKGASLRFNLKKALFDLGPTGFPFEKYMEAIFQDMGYKTQVDLMMQGECVQHEIDVLIEKDDKKNIVEVKFHNTPGNKTDVQVLLYTYARFLDVAKRNNIDKVWVVTNTKLSSDSIAYGRCKNINLIAWNYPDSGNLQDFVEKPNLYPITVLNSLSQQEKMRLMQDKIVLTCDLLEKPDQILLNKYLLNKNGLVEAKEQAKMICK